MSTLEFPPPEPPRNVYDMAPADCVTVGTAPVSIWIRVSKLLIDLDCRKMWTLLQNLRPSTSSLGHLVSFRRYVVFIHYPLVIRCKNQICIARLDPENFVRLAVIGKKSRFFFSSSPYEQQRSWRGFGGIYWTTWNKRPKCYKTSRSALQTRQLSGLY